MRQGFNPWVGKIPWRRKWQPTLVFLPGESHGQRSLVGYCPRDLKESDMTEWLSTAQHIKGLFSISSLIIDIPQSAHLPGLHCQWLNILSPPFIIRLILLPSRFSLHFDFLIKGSQWSPLFLKLVYHWIWATQLTSQLHSWVGKLCQLSTPAHCLFLYSLQAKNGVFILILYF